MMHCMDSQPDPVRREQPVESVRVADALIEYRVERSRRRKRLAFAAGPSGLITALAPASASAEEIAEAVRRNAPRILARRDGSPDAALPRRTAEADGVRVEYRVSENRRLRSLRLTLGDDGTPVVAAPPSAPDEVIREFVLEHAEWIAAERAAPTPPAAACGIEHGVLLYLGRETPIDEGPADGGDASVRLAGGRFELGMPPSVPARRRPAAARAAFRAWYARAAGRVLPPRVHAMAGRLGVRPRRVITRDQQQRWGSCAHDGVIRLNRRLVMAPPSVIDYVAAHEAAHLREQNHGPRFRDAVAEAVPDWRDRSRDLDALEHLMRL